MIPPSKRALVAGCNLVHPNLRHVTEFGVWTGISMRVIVDCLPDREYFGFDTFTGLPEPWVGRRHRLIEPQGAFDAGGTAPDIPGVTFYKGLFKDTIPEYLKIAQPIGLLHIDCDLYSSTVDVLYPLNDYIVANTIIVFDDWYYIVKNGSYKYNGHEQQAFYEWTNNRQRKFELVEPRVPGINMQMIVKILV